jgi:dynein heavy chain, axonemal
MIVIIILFLFYFSPLPAGMLAKIVPISLGQGQGPKATAGIKDGIANGKWILLQNCHLGLSYMPTMEGIIEAMDIATMEPDFRLW